MTTHRLLMIALVTTWGAVAPAAEPLQALLITGGCCHDYESQKQIITQGISQRANVVWDVVHEGGDSRDHRVSVYKEPGWAKGYDVIVHNECFGAVTDDEFVRSIAAAHHAGVPAVFIHCALHSYRSAPTGADAWRELIGVTSRSHEGKRALKVRVMERPHPILAGFPDEWMTPNGELYKIEKLWPNCTPLAQAYGEDTQQDHVVMWTNTFGKARVFGTSLGHHNETMNTAEWLGVVSRGLLWACGKLDERGQPHPGYNGSGVRPIEIKPPEPVADPKFKP
jgi:type 1 glutamine amidotransferase